MDALQKLQEELVLWVEKKKYESASELTLKDAATLLSYFGTFDEQRYLITDQTGAEVDPAKLSPACVQKFWLRIAFSVEARMNAPIDCPEELLLTRAVLPSLNKDARKAALRGDTAWMDYRDSQIDKYQADQDAIVIPAVKIEKNRKKGRAGATKQKAQAVRARYQHLLGQGYEQKKARLQITEEFNISESTSYRYLKMAEANQ